MLNRPDVYLLPFTLTLFQMPTSFFSTYCFTSRFALVPRLVRGISQFSSMFPSRLSAMLSDDCIIIITVQKLAGLKKKTKKKHWHNKGGGIGSKRGPVVRRVEWHLHFQRGGWNERLHCYNIWHPHFSCSTTSSFTLSLHFSLSVCLSPSVSPPFKY